MVRSWLILASCQCPVMFASKLLENWSVFCKMIHDFLSHNWKVALQVYFGMLDALLAAEQLPDEYQNSLQVQQCQAMSTTDPRRICDLNFTPRNAIYPVIFAQ